MRNKEFYLDIARHYGTPVYVYDMDVILEKLKNFREYFKNIKPDIHYAVKANANEYILQFFLNEGLGVDCVSTEEIKHVLDLGFSPEQVLYTPSCPSYDELKRAMEQGVNVHVSALEFLPQLARDFPGKSVGLRLNPDIDAGTNIKIATAHQASKFGIHEHIDEKLAEEINNMPLRIAGLHVHVGSDVTSWQSLARAFDFLMEKASLFPEVKYLDLGSGFKVPYRLEDQTIDMKSYAAYLEGRLQDKNYRIKFEPGKYLVSEAGVFLMQVNVVKKAGDKLFAGVNTGFNHFIRPMYYNAYHAIENLSNPEGLPAKYDVVGNLCEEDTFAYDRMLPRVRPGDILMLKNAGAYGFSMALAHYNLRSLPREVIVDGDRIMEI